MDGDSEILNFITFLDRVVPKEGAEVTFRAFGEVAVYATKNGYLRLALEFLKCAYPDQFKSYQDVDFNYLFRDDSEITIDFVTYSEKELESISG